MRKFSVLAVLLVIACGKRGDPRPPVPVIPRATSDLVVAQRADEIVLSWSYPSLTTAGRSLPAVRRIVVYRYFQEAPPDAAARPADTLQPGVPDPLIQFQGVPTLTPAQFAKLATRLDSIESANLAAATVGARLTFTDKPRLRSTTGRPLRYSYGVVTEGEDASGGLSNLESIVPLDVAAAPSTLKAIANAGGVTLEWPAPALSISGARAPVIIGYNVYRMAGTETGPAAGGDMGSPLNATPIAAMTYTDSPPYGEHRYRVTAVASAGPPRIESLPSPQATAMFRDLVSPPAPTNLSELIETRLVRLVWDAVEASDLAGYNVYRYEGTARLKMTPIGALKTTFFGDESVDPGISYTYAVTAIDTNGNESAEAKSNPVLVPKTP